MTTRREAMRLLGAATLGGTVAAGAAGAAARPLARQAGPAAGAKAAQADAAAPGARGWQVVTSAPGAARFAARALGAWQGAGQPPETDIDVFVDRSKRFQQVFGFGGAVTEAVVEVYATLAPAAQQAFLAACLDPDAGLGYTVLRTTIHSSDFGSRSYTYVRDGDAALASFSIAHDMNGRIPLLRRMLATAQAHGARVRVLATPWSAPGWMKSNGSMVDGGTLLPAYRDAWSRYIVKFVQAYEGAGIPIWGLSVQNEPMARQTWESMIFSAEDETRFLADHLGPALQASGLGARKIVVWDHNRDLLPQRAAHILSDPKARPYIWGVGYHWYETWAGGAPLHRNVAAVHEAYPDVNLLLTESCIEKFDPARLQDWANGERYGSQMIADLNAGGCGWVDWNLLLDARGGPNHKNNFCFAPLHADASGQLVFTPIYSFIGHFSRYIRPQARRVSATTSRSVLDATAFLNGDGRLAVVVMNRTEQPLRYRLFVDGKEAALEIPGRAIQTVVG